MRRKATVSKVNRLSPRREGEAASAARATSRQTYIRDLKVVNLPISTLTPYSGNPRTHSKRQIRQIAASISAFGWTNPILIDGHRMVIAGHGRLEASKLLGLSEVPTICIDNMTAAQKRAYILADNKLAANAGWDPELLTLELQGLVEMDLDFDVTVTGFEMAEIDLLIGQSEGEDDEADELPEIDPASPPISQPGDLWQAGQHRLLCADATQAESFKILMAGVRAEMVFTDPPYNLAVANISGRGSTKHSEFAMASGEMSEPDYIAFLSKALALLAEHSRDGSLHHICIDWRHFFELLTVGRRVYTEYKALCVWVKTNGGLGSLYRSRHELVAVFKNGTAAHVNNVQLGKHGRNRTNVWVYAGMNSFGSERAEALSGHPTIKPVRLVEDAILDCSTRGGAVLDAFLGSGTTMVAAERAGRRAFGLEHEPRYVDLALNRFQKLTGVKPVHVESGLDFEELGTARRTRSTTIGPPKSSK